MHAFFQAHRSRFIDRFGAQQGPIELRNLMLAVLDLDPVDFHRLPGPVLTELQQVRLMNAMEQRLEGVPLSRIVGEVSFLGNRIRVNEQVLVPRPETEVWVHGLIELIANCEMRIANSMSPSRDDQNNQMSEGHHISQFAIRISQLFVDVGTGSGAIAVSLAKAFPHASVVAIDISDAALVVAKANALSNHASNIEFLLGDLWPETLKEKIKSFEAVTVVANLPYIPAADLAELEIEVREHDPWLALDGGFDGLSLVRRLVKDCAGDLPEGAELHLELGQGQVDQLRAETFWQRDWNWQSSASDLAGIERFLCLRRRLPSPV